MKSKIRPYQLPLPHGQKPCQGRDTFLDLSPNIPTFQSAGFISCDCIKNFLMVVQREALISFNILVSSACLQSGTSDPNPVTRQSFLSKVNCDVRAQGKVAQWVPGRPEWVLVNFLHTATPHSSIPLHYLPSCEWISAYHLPHGLSNLQLTPATGNRI